MITCLLLIVPVYYMLSYNIVLAIIPISDCKFFIEICDCCFYTDVFFFAQLEKVLY